MEPSKVHYNKPQLKAMAVMAQHVRAVWGRGTGKSDGLLAPFMLNNAFSMPRSMGAIEGRTFAQILTRTLPPLVRGFERQGYRLNRDFVIREKPRPGWEYPLFTPLDWHNALAFRNGSAAILVSQNNPGSANGPSLDYALGDEVKFLKKEQHDEELMPAMRGNRDRFGHLSCHQSTCLATDMPTSPSQRWILEEEKLMEPMVIELILATQFEITKLQDAINGGVSASSARVYRSRINGLQRELNILRKGTVYFSMASSLDNIEVLGKEYITRMKQLLPDYLFRTSILNLRPDRVEGGFYPDLDDEQHCYYPGESQYVYQAGNQLFTGEKDLDDCRMDGDLVAGIPLDIGPDFGSSFNCMVVGQLFKDFNILNQVYVKHPVKIKGMAQSFHSYYQWHTPRHVVINYDHTMVGEDAVREYGFILELKRELEVLGWKVELFNLGQAPGHHEKYVFWGRRFAHADPLLPRVRFNAIKAEPTLLSMRLAGARQTRKGFEKDKTDEKNPSSDQAETTHLSDACDVLVIGRFLRLGATKLDYVDF